jgi:hypothetical protein
MGQRRTYLDRPPCILFNKHQAQTGRKCSPYKLKTGDSFCRTDRSRLICLQEYKEHAAALSKRDEQAVKDCILRSSRIWTILTLLPWATSGSIELLAAHLKEEIRNYDEPRDDRRLGTFIKQHERRRGDCVPGLPRPRRLPPVLFSIPSKASFDLVVKWIKEEERRLDEAEDKDQPLRLVSSDPLSWKYDQGMADHDRESSEATAKFQGDLHDDCSSLRQVASCSESSNYEAMDPSSRHGEGPTTSGQSPPAPEVMSLFGFPAWLEEMSDWFACTASEVREKEEVWKRVEEQERLEREYAEYVKMHGMDTSCFSDAGSSVLEGDDGEVRTIKDILEDPYRDFPVLTDEYLAYLQRKDDEEAKRKACCGKATRREMPDLVTEWTKDVITPDGLASIHKAWKKRFPGCTMTVEMVFSLVTRLAGANAVHSSVRVAALLAAKKRPRVESVGSD